MQFPHMAARNAVTLALSEDATADDVTTRWSVAPRQWATAVIITRQPGVAAGTITLDSLRAVAQTGIDAISVGTLTHSAPAMDLSMLLSISRS